MTSHTRLKTRGVLRCFSNAGSRTPLCCCVFQLLLYVMICRPKIQTSALTYHAQASEETGPKKGPIWRGLLRRSEQKHVCSLASRRPPSSLTKPQGQKGSQRPGQAPEPTPSCLCVTDPPGQPTLSKAPAHWRKPLLPEPAGEEPTDITSRHHPGLQACRGQGPATT